MQGFWWKLPGLRGLTPLRRGFLAAVSLVIFISLLLLATIHRFAASPSAELLNTIAQVGATLLIAYGVEISWFLKESRKRGGDRENWVGLVTGLGSCGLLGIGLALALTGSGGSLDLAEELVFSSSLVSIGLLGTLVAVLPLMVHEWAHTIHTEYPDE